MNFLTVKNSVVIAFCCALAWSCQAQNTTTPDEAIPPAVAKQLEAMQKRIDDLERELANRPTASQANQDGVAGAADHTLAEPTPAMPMQASTSGEGALT